MAQNLWTKEQLKLAYHLYCQLPFGKLHSRNKEIIQLATLIGRTPSAVAMKLTNFASLDPEVTGRGRRGLKGASGLDREVLAEFHSDWEGLAAEAELIRRKLGEGLPLEKLHEVDTDNGLMPENFNGETRRAVVQQRIKQYFFRRSVLSSYGGRCCMSGLTEPSLLVASHIVPWSKDKANRLNPSNGLCLSALHDRAFDKGLLTLSDNFCVVLSKRLRNCKEEIVKRVFLPLEGEAIERPKRFEPNLVFIARHRKEIFVDR